MWGDTIQHGVARFITCGGNSDTELGGGGGQTDKTDKSRTRKDKQTRKAHKQPKTSRQTNPQANGKSHLIKKLLPHAGLTSKNSIPFSAPINAKGFHVISTKGARRRGGKGGEEKGTIKDWVARVHCRLAQR